MNRGRPRRAIFLPIDERVRAPVVLLVDEVPLRDELRRMLAACGFSVEPEPGTRLDGRVVLVSARSPELAARRVLELRSRCFFEPDMIVCAPFGSLAREDAFVEEHDVAALSLPVEETRLRELLWVLEDCRPGRGRA